MLSKFPKKIRIVKKFFDNSNFNFEGKEILDIGGTNDYCEILRSIFKPGKVYLLNYDKSQLQGVENSFVQDATNLQFEDKSWDIITSFDVIEHLNNPDDLLSESYRVLKDEGLFIISSPNLADCFSRITFLFGYIPFFIHLVNIELEPHLTKKDQLCTINQFLHVKHSKNY
ncbi:class I SAM-dependent methyltransferase [Methanobacterium petrolearium]|uniref:class I SAM-dependent methyltransferase n=1 Tax=Methanobacterium petrolearium TaxID=710190 RepID=UPI003081D1D6|nr:hypothetical protein GCM10025861_21840 [Methanobacterium petrolearium]